MTTLNEAVEAAIDNKLAGVHTCLPGMVESYNIAKAMVSVKPLIKRVYRDGQQVALPVIVNVPLIFPRSAGGSLTFPIAKGDGVLLLFSERAMEVFLSKGGDQIPGDRRRFDLSDAIAIPGLLPFTVVSPAEPDAVVLRGGNMKVKIKSDKIAIGNDASEGAELLDLFNQLLEKLISATTVDPFSGTPQPFIPSVISDLTSIQAQLTTIRGTL